jgi:ubiquinone/menaquinone biosynthesis C-methylase UbiE
MAILIDSEATARTRARYDRNAPFYDLMEWGAARRLGRHRPDLWRRVQGPRVLEVGVGAGKNIPFYADRMAITAIDLSPRMLERARHRVARLGATVDLREKDV